MRRSRWVARWVNWPVVVGRRALLLLVLGCMDLVYGSALLVANASGDVNRWWTAARWWPAAQGELLAIDIGVWGTLWVGVGLTLVSAPLWRSDRHLFAAEMLLKTIWGAGAIAWAVDTASPGIWGPAATYVGLSLIVLLVAGWIDAPLRVRRYGGLSAQVVQSEPEPPPDDRGGARRERVDR